MLPLPRCEVSFPTTLDEALELLARPGARVLAGGTDLLPNLKRGVGRPSALVSLARVAGLDAIESDEHAVRIGARVTLARLARADELPASVVGAAASIASPQIRNVATIGGNLCLDTRCTYVNQPELWREALGHCIKAEGTECHVVPGGRRCVAASSADLPPILVALGASVRILSRHGMRSEPLERLYVADGAAPIALGAGDLLAQVVLPKTSGVRSAYRKLRVRQAIDFPLLGLGVAVQLRGEVVRAIRVVASGVGSAPRRVGGLDELAIDRRLDSATVGAIADRCFAALHPLANFAADPAWRRAMIPVLVREAFEEIQSRGGDDGTAQRT